MNRTAFTLMALSTQGTARRTLTVSASGSGATAVRMQPATVYGFAVPAHEAPITL